MGKISAKSAIVLINGYDFSTYASDFQQEASVNPIDVTGFTDAGKNFIPGIQTARILSTLLWDSALNKVHAALKSPGLTGVVTVLPEGYVLGAPTLSLPFMQGTYLPKGTPAGALSVGQIAFESYGSNVGVEMGWALQHGTITNTFAGTGYDDPTDAAVTAGCGASLHVWTPTSADTYVVKVQHSTTLGSGYADLITFVANGTSRLAERIVVASGTVNKYRRVIATRTGSAGDPFGFTVHFYHL